MVKPFAGPEEDEKGSKHQRVTVSVRTVSEFVLDLSAVVVGLTTLAARFFRAPLPMLTAA